MGGSTSDGLQGAFFRAFCAAAGTGGDETGKRGVGGRGAAGCDIPCHVPPHGRSLDRGQSRSLGVLGWFQLRAASDLLLLRLRLGFAP